MAGEQTPDLTMCLKPGIEVTIDGWRYRVSLVRRDETEVDITFDRIPGRPQFMRNPGVSETEVQR